MGRAVILDGEPLDPDRAAISIYDHGFLFGDSVYEVVRTRSGVPFRMDAHIARLRRSAAEIYLELPYRDSEIRAEAERAIRRADNPETYVRIIVTRGVGEIDLDARMVRVLGKGRKERVVPMGDVAGEAIEPVAC